MARTIGNVQPSSTEDETEGDELSHDGSSNAPPPRRLTRVRDASQSASQAVGSSQGLRRKQDSTQIQSAEEEEDVKPRKRRRLSVNSHVDGPEVEAEDSHSEMGDEEDEIDSNAQEQEEEAAAEDEHINVTRNVPRHPDGFETGAIVRIACQNFMTYDFVEFNPGPNLNMIIGPNGTGKSTIVSAIALGLGYQPKDLGRARHLSEFVKDNLKHGWVEVELKGHLGKKNTIIRRHLNKEDNKSSYLLNKKEATQAAVQSAVKALNIQVDNLCCFLPQEKVYEFAQLGPADLLKATQVCSGDKRLSEWHQTLIAQKQDWLTLQVALLSAREDLKREEDVNKRNERDIRRYEQRREYEFERNVLNVQIPYSQYQSLKTQYDAAVVEKKEAGLELHEAEEHNEPLLDRKEAAKRGEKQAAADIKEIDAHAVKMMNEGKKLEQKVKAAAASSENISAKLQEIAQDEVNRQKQLKKYEAEVQKNKDTLNRAKPETMDLGPLKAQITTVLTELRGIDEKINAVRDKQQEKQPIFADAERAVMDLRQRQARLADSDRQRVDQLRASDADTAYAYQWIVDNKDCLKSKAFKPVRLEIRAKDAKHARYVEAAIPYAVAKTIVLTNHDDFLLVAKCVAEAHVGPNQNQRGGPQRAPNQRLINTYELTNTLPPMDAFKRPLSDEDLKALGFDCWAIDLIEGPEEILRYVCSQSNLHRIPICFDRDRQIDETRLMTPNSPIRKWIANDTVTSFGVSEYGARKIFSQANSIKLEGTWAASDSKDAELDALQQQIVRGLARVDGLKTEFEVLSAEDNELRQKREEVAARKIALTAEKAAAEADQKAYQKAKVELSSAEKQLARVRAQPSSEAKEAELRTQLQVTSKNRVKAARDYVQKLMNHADTWAERIPKAFEQAHYDLHAVALANEASEGDAAVRAAKEAFAECSARVKELNKTAKEQLEQAKAELGRHNPEVQAEYERRRAEEGVRPITELEEALAEVEAKLSGLTPVNEAIIEAYERRSKVIERLRTQIEQKEQEERSLHDKLEKTRLKWEPKLNALVDQISTKFAKAFDTMGCSGAVQIEKDDDYDKWGIQILVAFRDGDPLIPLTGQRQSGGERSLSTILYLMSLSTFSTAPFSLVDEINQGMDARNERAVLDQLVSNVCDEVASQYFLITPKLLTNLRYHERMKVLCVNNGEWLPEKFSPRDFIKQRKQLAQRANGH